MNNKSVVCTVDISTGHYTWLNDTATVPTQPTLSAVRHYIEEMLIYQRKLKISKMIEKEKSDRNLQILMKI